ncbi:unnamed protein product [Adineta ricciae]|uniref:Uncharacterized protein n=1 Tax=Adineta ricciae TaxID=249248 RepID=A0A814CIG4_ADIRI|nr:unnamed protein product [Adineta ricciae]CAF1043122.1 unnamed protein product [Adineta ricciae]
MAEGGQNMSSGNVNGDRLQQSEQQGLSLKQTIFVFTFVTLEKGGPAIHEEELASKALHIQAKRFYLDVKQNRRGRFLKIAEVSSGGRKNRILMSMSAASELRDRLQTFDEQIHALGEQSIDNDEQVRSAVISRDDRKYYLDLRENERGKFLRISMVGSNTPRSQIAIPAQGVQEIWETLAKLIEEFGNEDDRDSIETPPAIEPTELPASKNLRVGNKNFYFDIGSNNRGVFLRISEVRPNSRTTITIPEKVWSRFRDDLSELIVTMDDKRNHSRINPGEESAIPPSGN